MKDIQPCLWFDNQAEQAAKLYTSLFGGSIGSTVRYGKAGSDVSGQPQGSVMTVEFSLAGTRFLGLNGGPHFKLNPSISFFVGCESVSEMDRLWGALNATVRMPLQKYDFAERYGWCEDAYGVNWQLMLGRRAQKISPALLFVKARFGKAEEAMRFYMSLFPRSGVDMMAKDEKTGAVLHAVFRLAGQGFVVLEGPGDHHFDFSPALSFIVNCDDQAELDSLWSKLSAVPEAEQCGWLQDKFGVSWQLVPSDWGQRMAEADPERQERLMRAVLGMKKIDIAALRAI